MKTNIYHWVDKKTHEEFTGSINEYCDLKPSVFYRVRKGRVTRKLVGAKGLRTYTNIENGDSYYGLKKERKYTVRWLMYDTQLKIYVLGAFGSRDCQNIFTEKQLARGGLGHVLYNDAFEVREVEDE